MRWLIAALILISTASHAGNEGLKACLKKHNYSVEKFDTFDFNAAAACNLDYITAKQEKRVKELREFLKEKPWYKGRNWQWEDCAKDNRCTKRYSWWSSKED